jgi:CheY-like chemotaxis protein
MRTKLGKVLLAEDNAEDVAFVQTAFSNIGMERSLMVVSDGAQALAYLRGDGRYADRDKFPIPVFMLLDLWLPRIDGFEVLRWVRSKRRLRRLPIMVFTGPDYPRDVTRAYVLGANLFVSKPFDSDEFNDSVKAIADYCLGPCKLPQIGFPGAVRKRLERNRKGARSVFRDFPGQDCITIRGQSRKAKRGHSVSSRPCGFQ